MSFSLQFLVFFCLTTCYGTVTKLKILGRRNSGIFFEGETMTISCTVTNAVKTPKIIWFMSGQRIIPDENKLIKVTFKGTSALSILTLQKLNFAEYRGQYLRCKDQENDESSLNTDPLKIGRISVTKSSDEFSEYGNNETLTCSLSEGKPEDIDYLLWRKIPSEKVLQTVSNMAKLELHVEFVNGNNAGYYECVFKASNGNFFLNKSIEIKVVPSNPKKQQKEIIYRIPNTVVLTCDIQGHPLTILWKVNCNSNSSGSNIYFNHTLVNQNRTLVINETNEESSGMYCCIGWNSAGKTKQLFRLKRPFVVPSNPKKQQKEIIYRIPNTVVLTCDIQGHPLSILWKVNCNSNSSGSNIYFNHTLVNQNRTLVINETNEESSGMYCCIGWNSAGKTKQLFSLKRPFVVPSNPKKQQKEIIYRIPNTVVLTCDIQGHPLTILWKVNCNSNSSGSNIYFNHTLVNQNRTLVINETNEESSGMYCCIGWNSAGKTKQLFSLKRPFDENCGKNNGRKLRNGLDIIFFFILCHVML